MKDFLNRIKSKQSNAICNCVYNGEKYPLSQTNLPRLFNHLFIEGKDVDVIVIDKSTGEEILKCESLQRR